MPSEFETDIEEMARRLRIEWVDNAPPRSALADDDRAIAAKLFDSNNYARLASTRNGERFRYRPTTIKRVEYYFALNEIELIGIGREGWNVEFIEASAKSIWRRLSNHQCAMAVQELSQRGYDVRLIVTEPMKRLGILSGPTADKEDNLSTLSDRPFAQTQPERSKRFDIMAQLNGYRVGGR